MMKFLICLAIILLVIIAIFWASSRWLRVYEHTVYFDNLPPHLHGVRFLHLSDLHSNSPHNINIDIWRHIDNLEFDFVVITGDIILDPRRTQYTPAEVLAPHVPYLRDLAARMPVFFVEGNHESDNFREISALMADLGIIFLRNDIISLEINGDILEIIGTADYSTLNRIGFDGFYALFDTPRPLFQLVLTHQPQLFDRIKNSGINLMLAGHTHGGQLRLPFVPTIYAPSQGFWPRYGNGFYHADSGAMLYVSRGIGTTYFPYRFWNRPEIAVFELQPTRP